MALATRKRLAKIAINKTQDLTEATACPKKRTITASTHAFYLTNSSRSYLSIEGSLIIQCLFA
jgi:hypothetical protein